MIRLELPWPISANDYWRSKVIRGQKFPIVYVSEEAKQYRNEVGWLARAAGVRSPIQGRLQVCMWLTPQIPKDAAKRFDASPDAWDMTVHCPDVDNVVKVTLDALKGIAFADDKQVHRLLVERAEPGKRGLLVTIEPWTPAWLRQASLFLAGAA